MKRMLPALAVVLVAGCSPQGTTPATSSPSTQTSSSSSSVAAPPSSTPPPVTVTVTVSSTPSPVPAPGPSTPAAAGGPCSDDDITVTNGPVEPANTLRHVVVSFKNTSSHSCTLFGYPGADLVTAAGGLMVHLERRPTNAVHHLTLNPGDVANAEAQAYAVDTATGNSCGREGTLVVTPPNDFAARTLPVSLPICSASIGSVD